MDHKEGAFPTPCTHTRSNVFLKELPKGEGASQGLLLHCCHQQFPCPSSGREGNDIPTQKGNSEVLAEDGVEDEALESTREQLRMPNAEATKEPCTLFLSPGQKQRQGACYEQKETSRGSISTFSKLAALGTASQNEAVFLTTALGGA